MDKLEDYQIVKEFRKQFQNYLHCFEVIDKEELDKKEGIEYREVLKGKQFIQLAPYAYDMFRFIIKVSKDQKAEFKKLVERRKLKEEDYIDSYNAGYDSALGDILKAIDNL